MQVESQLRAHQQVCALPAHTTACWKLTRPPQVEIKLRCSPVASSALRATRARTAVM